MTLLAGLAMVCAAADSRTTLPPFSLSEVVITGSRLKEPAFESPRAVSVTPLANGGASGANQRTVPDATREMPGVFIQKTTHGHGAPIVRGFIGRDVLMMVDGIRLNNSTYRSGPVQYLNTVDAAGIDRVELVRGAGSVLYGSDALGGALNVRTRSVFPSSPLSVHIGGHAQSADGGWTSRLEAAGSSGALGYRAGGSLKSFGDLRAGGSFGVEKPTAYAELDGDAAVRWQVDPSQALSVLYQGIGQSQVPRYHQYQGVSRVYGTPTFQRFTYDQTRHLGIIRYEGEGWAGMDMVETAVSWQRQLEGNQQQRVASSTVTELEDRVETFGGYAQATRTFGDHAVMAGVEAYGDSVQSLASGLNTTTGVRTARPSDSTFPDGSGYRTFGWFGQDQWRITPSWVVTPGLRWSRFDYRAALRNTPFAGTLQEDVFQDLTGSVSTAVGVAPGWRVMATVGQGFRAPNLDDLVTLRTTNQGVDVPTSSDLRPEKAWMGEAGVKWMEEAGEGSLFFYGMEITDRIVRKPGSYLGSPTLNGLPVFQKQNIGRARMVGVEWDGRLRLDPAFTVYGALTWTEGLNITDGEPLSKIPPLNGRFGVRYAESGWWVEGFTQWAGRQDRLSSTDQTDPRMDPSGTAGWATLNFRGEWEAGDGIRLNGGVHNLLDAAYREHGSGVDAPGINVFVGMEMQLF